ncbi:MAG: AAA family ATPase, partial [Myxococcales bacterium]|nr:AAA family ATPase [Myxococcales bacterium]
MPLIVPELSLVLLVGASGSGKSTFAARHFRPTQVLSSDHYRGVVSDDETDQSASADAFEALEFLARKRLERGRCTVVDATNTDPQYRKRWVSLAKAYHVLPVAIVLDVEPSVAIERNASRADRDFGGHVVRRQSRDLRRSLGHLRTEGFRYVHVLRGEDAVQDAEISFQRSWSDRRDDTGPFDIIGDIHGCFLELCELLDELGYAIGHEGERFVVTPPAGRRALFLGDLVDRGPASHRVLRLVMDMVEAGAALCIPGNHEAKLLRWLNGKNVKPSHGLQETIDQLSGEDQAFRDRVATFVDGLVSHLVLDGGRLVVAHAGMRRDLQGRASGRVREFALYGETTGETDEFGLPVRYPWARDYDGQAVVVYGHTPVPTAEWVNRTICIDTGCVFGG